MGMKMEAQKNTLSLTEKRVNDGRMYWWMAVILVMAIVAVFQQVATHDFVHYDDDVNIVANPHVDGLTAANLHWMLTDMSFTRYMPIGWFCYALDRQMFGLNPHLWHVGNLCVHVLNTLLLFLLLRQIVLLARNKEDDRNRVATWCAGLGALWWAINPLRVEPVSWASARIYGVAILFVLVWFWAWLRSRTEARESQRRFYAWISLAAFGASLLTYPLALCAPVALLALDVFPLKRAPLQLRGWFRREAWPLWQEKIPFFFVAFAILAVTAFARAGAGPRLRPVTLLEFGLIERGMQACYVLAYYVWKPWLPLDLAPAYPTLHVFNPFGWLFLAGAAFVIAVTCAVFLLRRRWPALPALWIAHVLILVPVLGLSEYPHSASDRYAHLHSLLWAVVIAGVLAGLWRVRQLRNISLGAVTLACACFAVLAVKQVDAWHNSLTLYTRIVTRFGENPGRGRFDEVLGAIHMQAGRTNDAVRAFEEAIFYETRRKDRNLYFESVIPRCERHLADICANLHDAVGEATHLEAALKAEREPAYIVATTLRLSTTLAPLNRRSEALPWLKKAAELAPGDSRIHHELGATYAESGNTGASQFHFTEERRLRQAMALNSRGS